MRFSPITYVDPLAQSFIIDSPQGAFITSLDLFFEEKDETVPVTVQIRTMVNGAPTQTVVPFSQVTLAAEDININATGYGTAETPTTFIFEAPVHLMQGVEYCFVVLSNSNKHKIYVSELGQYDLTESSRQYPPHARLSLQCRSIHLPRVRLCIASGAARSRCSFWLPAQALFAWAARSRSPAG